MASILENLSLENSIFRSYIFWSSILLLKMMAMALLTGLHRFKNKVCVKNNIFDWLTKVQLFSDFFKPWRLSALQRSTAQIWRPRRRKGPSGASKWSWKYFLICDRGIFLHPNRAKRIHRHQYFQSICNRQNNTLNSLRGDSNATSKSFIIYGLLYQHSLHGDPGNLLFYVKLWRRKIY